MANKVYLYDCHEYSKEKIDHAVFEIIDRVLSDRGCTEPLSEYLSGKNVVIKPNLVAKRVPEAAITTSPMFVSAAARYFVEKGAKVVIADSPGGLYNKAALSGVYSVCGMKAAAEESGAMLNQDFGFTTVTNHAGVASKSFNIINPLLSADLIVNICRLKTHSLCQMSAAVKNLYGAVPGLQKAEQHARFPVEKNFADYLIDLCLTVSPQINIIDAVVGMEGNGPAGGTLKKVGVILGSANPFSLDLAASAIMGFEPDEVSTVKNAIERGLCEKSLSEITLVGADIRQYIASFKRPDSTKGLINQLPNLFGGRLRKFLEPRPMVDPSVCIGCGECKRCCPAATIELVDKKAKINRDRCIRCYCCQELCPVKAVKIKRNAFLKI